MADEITSVTCNHCGAPLQVPASTRFVTCGYCGAQLEVHRTASAVYTEVLEQIDQRTEKMAEDLEVIRRQNEVERLDREWQMRRETLLSRDKAGNVSEPSAVGAMVGAIVSVVIGVVWMIATASSGAPPLFSLFGLLIMVAGVGGALASVGKATNFADAQREYQEQRAKLMDPSRSEPRN